MSQKLFQWACSEIRNTERKLGHELSWRFLTTPAKTLSKDTKVAFVALNPGGSTVPADHGRESCALGSAYVHEKWRSVELQHQVQSLFRGVAELTAVADYRSLMDSSLMAYYIPFRSPSFKNLNRPKESREFAFKLWSRLLEQLEPRLIVTIDQKTFSDFATILTRRPEITSLDSRTFKTGWGDYEADVVRFSDSAHKCTILVRFPHLSRFRIFDRPASKVHVQRILKFITRDLG